MRLPWRTVLGLLCSGALVVTNWLIFVWAVVNDNVLSTSLGYFITPLVQFLLGFLFLHERMTRMQRLGVVIAASGTLYLGWYLGTPPWISLSLAVTFGLYGLVRKLLDVGPMVGLLWETLLMALPAVAFLGWLIQSDQLYFGTAGVRQDLLLAISGLITVLPLVWFNVAARSLPLSTVGFFQYIAPSMTFLLSVFLWDEPFTRGHAVAFGCIWFALALVSAETWKRSRNRLAGTR
jgi:chloramphenicol-sensitive protein RarD